jgi:hypothetical protein
MSVRDSVQQMRETFEAQFEDSGHGKYLYRRSQKGEPLPVTVEERERFVRQYVRRIWLIMAGMMITLLAFVGITIWRIIATHSDFPDMLIYVGTAGIAAVAIALMYWIHGAPARELEGRTPVGRERSKEEMRAILFGRLSYWQLAGVAAMGFIFPFTLRSHPDVFHGWARLWLVFGASMVLMAAVQAFRKWRFESAHPDDSTGV